jgi:hypothetical protein
MSHFLLGWFVRARSIAQANHLPSRCEYLPRLGLFYSFKARPSALKARSPLPNWAAGASRSTLPTVLKQAIRGQTSVWVFAAN